MDMNKKLSEKVKTYFADMVIYKNPQQNSFFSAKSIPSFLRDWIIMRFADDNGKINLEEVAEFIKNNLPGPNDWEMLKGLMIKEGRSVRFLAKVRVEIDVKTGEGLFSLPGLGFPSRKYEAIVSSYVLSKYKEELLGQSETWGVIECEYDRNGVKGKEGAIVLVDFIPFRPYKVDVGYYQEARKEFTLDEWIDVLLQAVDYNPNGFLSEKQKLTLLSRLLPFVEKRVNLIELAPKGTGKSYIMSQISKYGWLVSGGSISRAKLFYDIQRKSPGLVSRYDFVVLDEIQTISFPDVNEIAGALKGYLESGECRVGSERVTGSAGLVLMGNIPEERMDENKNMFAELPDVFREGALLDRFHGFIKGWDVPRLKENMKAEGWALNVEYFSEIMHALREEITYPGLVDAILEVPRSADHRDTTAIKRICSGFLKLLFPHVRRVEDINKGEFEKYCLAPAMEMRSVIKQQLHLLEPGEYNDTVPDIKVRH